MLQVNQRYIHGILNGIIAEDRLKLYTKFILNGILKIHVLTVYSRHTKGTLKA